mgnify:CR=1 FL=1
MSALGELSSMSRHRKARARRREETPDNLAGYLFLAPWLIGLIVITIGPMAASLYLSFTDYNLLQSPTFIAFDNYVRMFHDPRLMNSLKVTFIYVLVGTPLQLIVALTIAVLLNQGMRGLAFYRSVFYLPA